MILERRTGICSMRYKNETLDKTNGVVYTPTDLSVYLAEQMVFYSKIDIASTDSISLLDPAIGKGELLIALIRTIRSINPNIIIKAIGYEKNPIVALSTQTNIESLFSSIDISIYAADFLSEAKNMTDKFDFIIANPPYVRTQILGSETAQEISKGLNLSGRIDIYYAFLLNMKKMMSKRGVSGYITSNKFLTIKAGSAVRDFMIDNYTIHKIVDFGDTKLFPASVLPCIVVFSLGSTEEADSVNFVSIYESKEKSTVAAQCKSIFENIK